jgi:hypothetical protein
MSVCSLSSGHSAAVPSATLTSPASRTIERPVAVPAPAATLAPAPDSRVLDVLV